MYYYIINPAAGKGAINQLQDKLRLKLQQLGISGEFVKTTGTADATRLAKLAVEKGHTTIVAVGGDGTVNEVINGVTKDNVAVGIIPIGNSNMLASRLGINNWSQACDVLAARRLVSFGLMAAGQKFFLSTLTLGFETDLEKNVELADQSGLKSRLSQFGQGLGHAANYQTLTAKISVDDKFELECPLFTLSVGNMKFQNPHHDNKLVVSLSDKPSRRHMATFLWQRVRGGAPLEEAATTRFLADRVVITTDPPTGITIDGKVAGRTPVAIRLTERRIRFITEKQVAGFSP